MDLNYKLVNLFPSSIHSLGIDNFNDYRGKLIEEIYQERDEDPIGRKISNRGGWHSKPFDLKDKNKPPFKFFMDIQIYVANTFKEYGWRYTPGKVSLTEMWAIINKKNNFNLEHTHPNNYLSAAYYVKAPNNCGSFVVTNPNSVARERIPISDNKTEFNQNIAHIKPEEGDLLLFPAYLPHSVGMNLSDEDRIVISFNVDILK